MAVRQPRYSKEEFAQRGDHLYETQVRPQVEAGNHGKIVAIDLETGDFEVDASEITACDHLEARHPDAQIWIVRVAAISTALYLTCQFFPDDDPNFSRNRSLSLPISLLSRSFNLPR